MNKNKTYPIPDPFHTAQRFSKFVDRRANECHEWLGQKNEKGYGRFLFERKLHYAHRFAWMLRYREWPPEDMCVCHKCDNPCCVNTEHFFLGTHADNVADRQAKGRGTKPPIQKPKWTKAQAKMIDDFIIRNGHGAKGFASRWFGIPLSTLERMRKSNGLQDA